MKLEIETSLMETLKGCKNEPLTVLDADNPRTWIHSINDREFELSNWNEIIHRVNLHEELIEALKECSPLIDDLINKTPTSEYRNRLTDINIKLKTYIK